MSIVRFSYITTILISISILFSGSAAAVTISGQTSNVFVFQEKLAARGNVKALYKLGYMYEMGEGVDADLAEAKKCYQGAVAKDYEPAKLRLTYMDVKAKGYNKGKDADWLKSVKSQSSGRSVESLEALFLLGQLYREGLGVKKDLKKSLEIMYELSMEGVIAADAETSKIEAEITANQLKKKKSDAALAKKEAKKAQQAAKAKQAEQAAKAKQAAKKSPAVDSATKAVAVTESAARPAAAEKQVTEKSATQAKKVAAVAVVAKPAKVDKRSKKRKRYDAIMKQLAEEQALINEIQGGDADGEI